MTGNIEMLATVLMVVLARISTFIAVIPILSSARVPQSIRAYIALGLATAIMPILYDQIAATLTSNDGVLIVAVLVNEVLIGLLLGFLIRLFFLAILFAAEVMAQVVGFVGMAGPGIVENDLAAPLANLVILMIAVLFFTYNVHHHIIEHILISYQRLPVGGVLDPSLSFTGLGNALSQAFTVVTPLAGPFLLYAVVCNLLVGLANRLVPQVPIQLVTGPAILFGGMMVALFSLSVGMDPIMKSFIRIIAEAE